MKKHILSCLLFVISFNGYSQVNYTQEPGKTTQYEVSMTEYELDKDAEALVIYDHGEYYFQGDDNQGILLHMIRRVKIKILKQAGIEHANFEIPFYQENNNWEDIEYINGVTYNYDDLQLKKTELTSSNIFEEKINDKLKVKKIALPNVREGSVIEFSYKIKTPYIFNMREWAFQKKIPVVHSQLKYRAIPYYVYTYIVKGTNKLDEFSSDVRNSEIRFRNLLYKEVEYLFGMKDIPAFKDEDFITSPNDYMIAINFQLSKLNYPGGGSKDIMTTWPAMCDDFIKEEWFGKYIKNSEKEAKKILPTLALEGKEPIDKTEIIADYVKRNFNWNGVYGKYAQEKASTLLKQKTGNVANINLFLIGLLKAAGIETYPIVLSTRENGVVSKDHPFQQFFNYVIAMVVIDGKPIFIDATESMLHFNALPPRCVNVDGLIVKPKSENWIYIQQKGLTIKQKKLNIKINPDDKKMTVDAKYTGTDFDAYNYRKIYLGKEENLVRFLKESNAIEVNDGVVVEESEKFNKPISFSFTFDRPIENVSNKLFVHPFANTSITENPFKQTKRTLLVDLMFVRGEIYKSTIKIPTGYKVEYLPPVFEISNNVMSASLTVEENNGVIEVNAFYTLKESLYAAESYDKLKQSYAEMIKHFSEMIVL